MVKNFHNVWGALFLLVYAGNAFSEENMYMDGRTLKNLCTEYGEAKLEQKLSVDSTQPFMRCLHYVQGVFETTIFYERMMYTISGNHLICIPRKAVTTDQVILLTNEYLKTHPEKLDSQGIVSIMAALRESYPCNR